MELKNGVSVLAKDSVISLVAGCLLLSVAVSQDFSTSSDGLCSTRDLYLYGTCRPLACQGNETILPGNSYCDVHTRTLGVRHVRCVVNLPCCVWRGTCRQACGGNEDRLTLLTECGARSDVCCLPRGGTASGTTVSAPEQRSSRGQGQCAANRAVVPRIIGGGVAQPTDWPWMVRLVYTEDPGSVCAGVLVDDDTVVTVAHCINGISASQLQVLVGDYDLTQVDSGEELVPVRSVELSRSYAQGRRGNDFAVIKLARSIVFTPTKMAACLPDPSVQILPQGNPQSQCFVAGWGITERRQVSSRLRTAPVRLLDLGTCNAIVSSISGRFDEIPSDMICTDTSATRTDACLYDDGGSLTCRDANGRFTLLGLVSEYSCGSLPTLYTRVDNYTSAILARL